MNVMEQLKAGFLILDGAMGTMLQKRGLAAGALPELLNLHDPGVVTQIHREYAEAGADVITANTFGAHELKLQDHSVEEVVGAGIKCARDAGARFTALDVGPTGRLVGPLGDLSFERAYEVFRRQMTAGEKSGADLIIIETISDPYEAKAAILAAKENTKLPVFCTMTFEESSRTFLGCDALTATVILQGLGVDALGVNCSLGPDKIAPIVKTMLKYSHVPVILQANAGLPVLRGGEAFYEMPPEVYAGHAAQMARLGARVIGGCCGTTPEHIREIRRQLEGMKPVVTNPARVGMCTSGSRTVIFDGAAIAVGERINPTGKDELEAALRLKDMDYLADMAIEQVDAGAQILDVNVGLPGLDEPAAMAWAIREIQQAVAVPLQIDSANPAAIEAGLRCYNGKAVINSVNGKAESMAAIFPLAKKYGAMVIALTLDECGIPPDASGRLTIARRIRDTALSYGFPGEDLLIDCLALTAAAQQEQVPQTLEAVRLVKSELGLKTVLGVSNVSFGLPGRKIINATFLAAAFGAGLDCAIINPLCAGCREVLDVWRVLSGEDKDAQDFIDKYAR